MLCGVVAYGDNVYSRFCTSCTVNWCFGSRTSPQGFESAGAFTRHPATLPLCTMPHHDMLYCCYCLISNCVGPIPQVFQFTRAPSCLDATSPLFTPVTYHDITYCCCAAASWNCFRPSPQELQLLAASIRLPAMGPCYLSYVCLQQQWFASAVDITSLARAAAFAAAGPEVRKDLMDYTATSTAAAMQVGGLLWTRLEGC
jgi:hypothetical protein